MLGRNQRICRNQCGRRTVAHAGRNTGRLGVGGRRFHFRVISERFWRRRVRVALDCLELGLSVALGFRSQHLVPVSFPRAARAVARGRSGSAVAVRRVRRGRRRASAVRAAAAVGAASRPVRRPDHHVLQLHLSKDEWQLVVVKKVEHRVLFVRKQKEN